jgi:endonuclease YncB( thermonuclease family)
VFGTGSFHLSSQHFTLHFRHIRARFSEILPLSSRAANMRIVQILAMRELHQSFGPRRMVALALFAGVAMSATLSADAGSDAGPTEVAGPARVVDGDTIAIDGIRIRLEGIDAPEAGQTCGLRLSGSWACGVKAAVALSRLVEGKEVACRARGLDRYGRMLGVCFVGAQDVNAFMVRQGLAWAFVKYSTSYLKEEADARADGIGIWQGDATPPWEYRAQRWASVEHEAPEGCAIKGNVTARGKIYHMPWSPWYGRIKIDPAKGRRWFCTEAEAVAAGWRAVNVN